MEIKDQMKNLAEFIKRNNQKVIPVWPLKKRENAFSNKSRRLFLAALLDEPDFGYNYNTITTEKRWREVLEQKAIEAGYQLIEYKVEQ